MKLALHSTSFSKQISAQILGSTEERLIQTIGYDTRKILNPESCVFFALNGEFRNGHSFLKEAYNKGIRLFVVSEKQNEADFVGAQFFLVEDCLLALQLLAQKHRERFSIPVIGITGSVGKTIVKEWLYHLLSDSYLIVRSPKSYNSQLGVALSVLELDESHQLAIFEAGISKPGEMEALEQMIQPTIGVFTAFGSAHAHHFASKEEQLQEKSRLFTSCQLIFVQAEIPFESRVRTERIDPKNFEDFLKNSPFTDQASRSNLSLAVAVAKHLDVKEATIREKIKSLPRLALRMETFDGIHGNVIINDAYNADLDALTQSLEYQLSLANNKLRTAIIGVDGLSESQIQKIKHKLKQYKLYQCFFIAGDELPPVDDIHQQVVLIKGTRVTQIQRIARLFQLKKHKTRVEIDLSAVKNNLTFWRNSVGKNTKLLIMVKASSYGSGAEKMAEYLERNGVEYLGVAYADEGIELRKHGIKLPILVMNADEDSFDEIIQHHLEPTIFTYSMLDGFVKTLIDHNLENYPVHLKFDTGMRRLGFEPNEVNKVIDLIQTQPEIHIQSIYSHLAESDNLADNAFTKQQIQRFQEVVAAFDKRLSYPFLKHILNSEGIVRFPEAQFDMVRIGIGLYGISVNPEIQNQLKAVISWKSIVSQIKTVQAGESVGYSRKFIAPTTRKIAIIPVGYADGFRRSLSQGKGGMYIRETYCPVLGNVCMDMTMLDVTNLDVLEGDEVEIIGIHQSVEDFASHMDTISYEVFTSLSKRLHRVYIEE